MAVPVRALAHMLLEPPPASRAGQSKR